MTESPKRKLAYFVFARSEATKQSQYINQKNKIEITAVIRHSADSLAMPNECGFGLTPTAVKSK